MRARQAAVGGDGLAVDVGRRVAQEETGECGDLGRLTIAARRVQLTDAFVGAAFACPPDVVIAAQLLRRPSGADFALRQWFRVRVVSLVSMWRCFRGGVPRWSYGSRCGVGSVVSMSG